MLSCMADVEVTERIAADPDAVWSLISDITQMGRWSPETTSCRWLGGATEPEVGAQFRGSNRHRVLRWWTTCTVTSAHRGRRFAFEVHSAGVPISSWAYDIRPAGDACSVTESWSDRRPMLMRVSSIPVTGIADRPGHNRHGMRATLAALKDAAERP